MQRNTTRQRRNTILNQAQSVIRANYREFDFGLTDLAETVDTSPRQLQRIFAESGEGFRSYLLRVRMTEARRLITREVNPLPIASTSWRVGYRQASGLRQAFVRYWGVNPSELQSSAPEYLGNQSFPPRESRDGQQLSAAAIVAK